MKHNWEIKSFEDCLEKIVYTNKIQRLLFLGTGKYPIISQEQDYINGYWNDSADLFKINKPVVLFGDHTQILKYIDFDFVLGADGVKIFQPISRLDSKYFYYYLTSIELKNLGYARHYRLLKEITIPLPPLPEQRRLVAILDKAFAAIARAKENAEKNLANACELFESYLQGIFSNPGDGWEEKRLGEVCDEIFAGGDAPQDNFSKEKNEKFKIPIYANAVKDRGLYGYTNIARVTEPSITIAARGSGTGHTEIRNEPFFPIVRLIVLLPKLSLVHLEFLKHVVDNFDIMRSGSAIPQLTVPMIKEYNVLFPTLSEQKRIVTKLDALSAETKRLEEIYKQKIANLDELRKSILARAFRGELP